MPFPRPKVDVDLRAYFGDEERGHAKKELIVLHETVSHNRPGTGDIIGPALFLDATGLEIHGIIDMEGHSAWCYDPTAIYDHAASGDGNVNTRSIGFELVSEVPLEKSPAKRREMWNLSGPRQWQLHRISQWIAYLSESQGIPIRYSDGRRAGVTSHWDVSHTFLGGDGHWDCWPKHRAGHFPLMYVIRHAQHLLRKT